MLEMLEGTRGRSEIKTKNTDAEADVFVVSVSLRTGAVKAADCVAALGGAADAGFGALVVVDALVPVVVLVVAVGTLATESSVDVHASAVAVTLASDALVDVCKNIGGK